ncbi:hypothetical protein CBM2634_P10002 [Cupriavidus taiwanensis]|uniref:Uncharacterized protein n=1 Tax=Cupriavidus taiwanensis TaxID=164546 RepID=A0A375JA86_9BURK|nr:hypothetical protein CBM2634_P10002 [Cupriavidus taiwanensis]
MPEDESHPVGIKATIDGIQDRATERNTMMSLHHRWSVGGQDGHGVTFADSTLDQRASQTPTAFPGRSPGLPQVAVNDGIPVRILLCTPIQKVQRCQRYVVCVGSFQADLVNALAHDCLLPGSMSLRCALRWNLKGRANSLVTLSCTGQCRAAWYLGRK